MKISHFLLNILNLTLFNYLLSISIAFSISGNYLVDLESNEVSSFMSDASLWSVGPPGLVDSNVRVSFCYNNYLLGGYNILASPQYNNYFQRTYSGLPTPHNMVRFSFLAQPVDSWDGATATWPGDTFQLQFDNGAILWGWLLSTYSSYSGVNICGGSFVDYPSIRTIVDFPHTASTLNVKVWSHFDQASNDESFGFRDVNMLFYTADTPSALSYCGIASFTLKVPYCPCPSSRAYMYPVESGTCYPCDVTCASCTTSAANTCTSCDKGRFLTATPTGSCDLCHPTCVECTAADRFSCTACVSGQYLIPDGHCDIECPLPLVTITNAKTDLCVLPTGCANNYLYWDATCDATCLFPLVPIIVDSYFNLCTYKCEEEQYLWWDGTCHADCPSPLTKRTTRARLFCDYTCSSGTGILYWDGVCEATCAFPLQSHTVGVGVGYVKTICDYPCLATQYLYWNGTCIDDCPIPPLVKATTHGSNLCRFPCSPVTWVDYWDGTCEATCLPPRTLVAEGKIYVRYFCRYACNVGEFLYWNGTCSTECVPPLTYTLQKGKYFCNYPCSSGQFLHWDGTCQNSCPSPLKIRVEAGLYYCDFPCNMATEYLYWNNSCLSYCNSPLTVTTIAAARFCNYPCSPTTNFLYWNSSCLTTCPAPLVKVVEGNPSRNYCTYPCRSDQYLYWTSICGDSCPVPYIARAEAGKNYCAYPCGITQFLYWTGTCLNSCDPPLSQRTDSTGAQYCDFPCTDTTDYLYWDGTCEDSCASPLTNSTLGTGEYYRKFCLFKCTTSAAPYLYWNGSCKDSCNYPLQIETYKGELLCKGPCDDPTEYYYEDSKTCKVGCFSPYIIDTSYGYNRCLSPEALKSENWFIRNILTPPSGEGTVTLVTLVKMMQHVRYLDIKMPPRLQRLALSKGRNVLNLKIGWTMPAMEQVDFISSSLPAVFQRHDFPSSFLVNYFQYLTTMLIVIIAAVIFTILEKAAKIYDQPNLQSIFETLRAITRWSSLLILVSTSIDDVVLFSSFQFRTLSATASSDYTILAFLVSLAMLGVQIFFLAGTFWLCIRAQASMQTAISKDKSHTGGTNFMIEKRDFQVVFKGFQSNFLLNQMFYLMYTVRLMAPMIIAAYLWSYPFAQSILQTTINAIILLYVVIAHPIEKKVNHIQIIILEILYLLMNICVIILVSLDKSNRTLSGFGIFMGDMVIFCNWLVNVTVLVFLFVKIMSETRVIRDTIKQHKSTGQIGLWLQLLAVPIQQGGMGFEEMIGTHSFSSQYKLLQTQNLPVRSNLPQNRIHNRSLEMTQVSQRAGDVSPKSQILHKPQFDVDDDIPATSMFYPQATHGSGSHKFVESFRNTQRRSARNSSNL